MDNLQPSVPPINTNSTSNSNIPTPIGQNNQSIVKNEEVNQLKKMSNNEIVGSNPNPTQKQNPPIKSNKSWTKRILLAVLIIVILLFVFGIGFGEYNNYKTEDGKHSITKKSVLCFPFPSEYIVSVICTKTIILVDNKIRGIAPWSVNEVVLSDDAKRIAYVANGGMNNIITISDKGSKSFGMVYNLNFTSGSFYYLALENNDWIYYKENQEVWRINDADSPKMAFSKNNESILVQYKSDGKYGVAFNGVKSELYDEIKPNTSIISDDGKNWAFVARKNDQEGYFIVHNGKEEKRYTNIHQLRFSPDGNHFAYITSWGDNMRFVYNGKESEDFFGICIDGAIYEKCASPFSTIFNEFGNYYFVAEKNSKQFYVVDGVKREGYTKVKGIIFSKENHFAYIGESASNQTVIYDGKKIAEYPSVSKVFFSPDGKHFGYSAEDGNGNYFIYYDDGKKVEGTEPNDFINGKFSDDNSYLVYGNFEDEKVPVSGNGYRVDKNAREESVLGNVVFNDPNMNEAVPKATPKEQVSTTTQENVSITYGQIQIQYSHFDPNNTLTIQDLLQNKDGQYNAISVLYDKSEFGSIFVVDKGSVFWKNGKQIDTNSIWAELQSSTQAGVDYSQPDNSHYYGKNIYLK